MYFYNIEGTMIIKYEVKLNYKKLKELKKEIIDNCSLIKHQIEETINPIIVFNSIYMRNYKSIKTNKKDFKTKKSIYLVTYDLYNPPYLVELINELLKENFSIITEILNYKENFSIEVFEIKDRYNKLLNELYDPDYVKIYKSQVQEDDSKNRLNLLRELEKLLSNYQIEKEEHSKKTDIEKYRLKVLDCIKLKEIQKLPIEYLSFVQDFFNESNEKTISKTLNKILTRKLLNDEKKEF